MAFDAASLFNSLARQEGLGQVWLVDISIDNFATSLYRYSTVSCTVGGNDYDGRIAEKGLGKLSRGFGLDSTPRAGMVTLLLQNTDFAADWLVDRATVASQVFRARFKLTLLLYPLGNFSNYQTKVLGTFKCLTFPMRDTSSVTVQLSDDTMGLFDQPLTSPTIREWSEDAGSTVDNCPVHPTYVPRAASDWDQPLPLAFGAGRLVCFPADASHGNEAVGGTAVGVMDFCRAIMVCATRSSDAVVPTDERGTTGDVRALWGTYGPDTMVGTTRWADGAGTTVSIPSSFYVPADTPTNIIGTTGRSYTIWEPQKTQLITKDGVTWKLLWVKFDIQRYAAWFRLTRRFQVGGQQPDGSTAPTAYLVPQAPSSSTAGFDYGAMFAAFTNFQVLGHPYSAMTVRNVDEQLAPNVIKDLITYYSKGSFTDVDTTRFATALSMNPMAVSGVLQPARPVTSRFSYSKLLPPPDALTSGQLRQAFVDICQSSDLDLAMTWSGQLAVYGSYFSFADITNVRATIDETRCIDVVERIPSKGERWAPYNRVYIYSPDGQPHGPFDNPDASIDWGTTLERTLQGKWLYPYTPAQSLYENTWGSMRRLESVVRPVIRFVTDREGLSLDLGDLFNFTWSRGGSGGPYSADTFRVESMTIDPETLAVGVEAVWVDDVNSVRPFLLDNETLLLRLSPAVSGSGTLTVQDGSNTVTCTGGGFNAAGVTEGDILVLKDSTQALNVFTRFRRIRITEHTDDVTLLIDGIDMDFDAPVGAVIAQADWYIERGYTTYPTSVSDPVNYPNDGDMYGKGCSATDQYSETTFANVMI